MKRFLALLMAILMLAMTMALTACGGGEESTDPETEQTETQEPAEGGQAEDPAEDPAPTGGADLEGLKAQMLSDAGLTDYIDIPAENAVSTYGLDPAGVVTVAAFNAMTGAAFPEEVVMVQAADEAAAAAVAAQLEGRLAAIAEQAASYDPDSLQLAENCDVVVDGVYVGLFFSQHYDAMAAAFEAAV